MRINHNISALNTYNQMNVNQNAATKNMEKLSSGLRINRAGDDAAGLAISEKMRGQIRGLEQASTNAQDGISLIQTAEGALNETHAILQRQRELAVQSSNDTNTEADRNEIQKEMDQLSEEITRIANNTQFNEKNLLDGSFEGKFHIGANAGQDINLSIDKMDAKALGIDGGSVLGMDVKTEDGKSVTINFASSTEVGNGEVGATTATKNDDGSITITLAQSAGVAADDTDPDNIIEGTVGAISAKLDDIKTALEAEGLTVEVGEDFDLDKVVAGQPDSVTIGTTGINVSSQESASSAITTLDAAIQTVSAQRSNLGAVQNRLEHTINNLGTSAENLTAAESRIRDVDMAKEMMEMTKNNILQQAAQSMLAQANQNPQNVLQLLR